MTKNRWLVGNSVLAVAIVSLAGCSSSQVVKPPEEQEDKILSRIDGFSSRPSWLKESEPFKVENAEVVSLGMTTIPADNRIEAAYRIAESNAKASIASSVEQRLEYILQNAEEGTSIDASQTRYIGAEATKLVSNSLRPKNRYWEKVATTLSNGSRVMQYRVFASVSMPEADFKRAVIDALRAQQGKGGLTADFAKKVDQHWEQFTQGEKKE